MDILQIGQIESGSNSPSISMSASGQEIPALSFLSALLSILLAPDAQKGVVKSQGSGSEKEIESDNLSPLGISSISISTGCQAPAQLNDLACNSPLPPLTLRGGIKGGVTVALSHSKEDITLAEGSPQIAYQKTEINPFDSKNPEEIQKPENATIKNNLATEQILKQQSSKLEVSPAVQQTSRANPEQQNSRPEVSPADQQSSRVAENLGMNPSFKNYCSTALRRDKEDPDHPDYGFKVSEVKADIPQDQRPPLISGKEMRVTESDIKSEMPHVTSTISQIERVPEITESTDAMLRVTVEHDEIGELDIRLVLNKGLINGLIKTPEVSTADLIARNIPGIIDSLIKDGLNIGNLSVTIRDNGSGGREDLNPERSYRRKEAIDLNPQKVLSDGEAIPGDNYINIFV